MSGENGVYDQVVSQLLERVQQSDQPEFVQLAREIAAYPALLPSVLTKLFERAEALGIETRLVQVLLSPKSKVWERLGDVALVGDCSVGSPAFEQFKKMVGRFATAAKEPLEFEDEMTVSAHREVRPLLRRLRNASVTADVDAGNIHDRAEHVAKRLDLNRRVLNYLFERRADQSVARETWEQQFRVSAALEQLISSARLPIDQRVGLFSEEVRASLAAAFAPGQPLVLTFHHGGFATLRQVLLDEVKPGAVYLTNHDKAANRLNVIADSASAMLEGTRALLRGDTVVISPDGLQGADGPEIEVLGIRTNIKSGAIMLAFETFAPTAWLTIGREGRQFVPIMKQGPTREKGERYSSFAKRFAVFYQDCLNDAFSGSPQNLVFKPQWLRLLARA